MVVGEMKRECHRDSSKQTNKISPYFSRLVAGHQSAEQAKKPAYSMLKSRYLARHSHIQSSGLCRCSGKEKSKDFAFFVPCDEAPCESRLARRFGKIGWCRTLKIIHRA